MLEFAFAECHQMETLKCGNTPCPFVEFHPSCLAISTQLPRLWYCPHCCRLPQFKRARKVKESFSEIIAKALSLDGICICQAVPQQSDKLLASQRKLSEWKNISLNLSRLQEKAKCTDCKKHYAKRFHDSTGVSTGTCQENPVATATCSSQSHNDKPGLYESDNAHDSDSEEESADDIEVTLVTTCESERHRSLRNLDEQDYQLIMSHHGWLDGAIIHSA